MKYYPRITAFSMQDENEIFFMMADFEEPDLKALKLISKKFPAFTAKSLGAIFQSLKSRSERT